MPHPTHDNRLTAYYSSKMDGGGGLQQALTLLLGQLYTTKQNNYSCNSSSSRKLHCWRTFLTYNGHFQADSIIFWSIAINSDTDTDNLNTDNLNNLNYLIMVFRMSRGNHHNLLILTLVICKTEIFNMLTLFSLKPHATTCLLGPCFHSMHRCAITRFVISLPLEMHNGSMDFPAEQCTNGTAA